MSDGQLGGSLGMCNGGTAKLQYHTHNVQYLPSVYVLVMYPPFERRWLFPSAIYGAGKHTSSGPSYHSL